MQSNHVKKLFYCGSFGIGGSFEAAVGIAWTFNVVMEVAFL